MLTLRCRHVFFLWCRFSRTTFVHTLNYTFPSVLLYGPSDSVTVQVDSCRESHMSTKTRRVTGLCFMVKKTHGRVGEGLYTKIPPTVTTICVRVCVCGKTVPCYSYTGFNPKSHVVGRPVGLFFGRSRRFTPSRRRRRRHLALLH